MPKNKVIDASILEPKVGGMNHCILVCIHVEFVVRSRAFARRLQVRCFGHVYLKKDRLQGGSCRSKRGASSSELMGCQTTRKERVRLICSLLNLAFVLQACDALVCTRKIYDIS